MKATRCVRVATAAALSLLTLAASCLAVTQAPTEQAQAFTMNDYYNKIASHDQLKSQLAGVNQDLANIILKLDDLNSNQIPAAVQAVDQANQAAQEAQNVAEATTQRLQAAQQDKADLEEKIAKTGADYDDAKDTVAQLARDSFHGSDVSDVMDVVTNAKSTQEFVDRMQSQAAVTRSEANAANEAGSELGTSRNRKERLEAIEDKIAQLKKQADEQAVKAQEAASQAQEKQASLQKLRDEGTQARKQFEARKSELTSQAAKEAAEIVAMKSEIDSWAAQQSSQNTTVNASQGTQQQNGSGNITPSQPSNPPVNNNGGGRASGMNYSVPGNCAPMSAYCYGHRTGDVGNAYPPRQCTLWAYLRRHQLGLPVGSYMGNGEAWARTGRSLGYLVNNTPHVGAVMVFARGQRVTSWNADWQYGHVAVVERVNADGSVLVSEGGTGFATFPAYETIYNASQYEYVHY